MFNYEVPMVWSVVSFRGLMVTCISKSKCIGTFVVMCSSLDKFCVLLTVHRCIFLWIKPTWWTIFLSMFISFLYMFRATICPSSGETTVFMRHLVLAILCGWLSGMFGMHTRQSVMQNNKYQVSHRYSCFSWWWAHSHPKPVEKRNKHTK